jgi:hypothetical protein
MLSNTMNLANFAEMDQSRIKGRRGQHPAHGPAAALCGLDNRLIDGGKDVSPTHPPHFTPQKH